MTRSRREFIQGAAAIGATLAFAGTARASKAAWRERRELFPEGVASGDPDHQSVILWTRRPFENGEREVLTVEVAEDEAFRKVVATSPAPVSRSADWTCRVLVAGLKPASVYFYRFTDADGNGSRVGRTITAPDPADGRAVNFAFVSCQDINDGTLNAYRRMIFEDEKLAPVDQIGFVLHLGDFIYEVMWYPEDLKTRYDRTVFEVCRIPDAQKAGKIHYPVTLEGYRTIYRAYLHNPELQDARARWPFVAIWDNHEFSWVGWQSIVKGGGYERPGQTVKVAANQAWFEYLPARVTRPNSTSLETFEPPAVKDVKIERFDATGIGDEPNNRIAIDSLKVYRALRYGKHLDLMLTDQHSYRGPDPVESPELEKLGGEEFPSMFPEELRRILDGGRAYDGGKPPAELRFGKNTCVNPAKDAAPFTILGATQKAWFKERLRSSSATWKIWGNSQGAVDERCDPQNLPEGLTAPWPAGAGYANMGNSDFGNAYSERGEIYDLVRENRITGFAIVSGDKHSFWAGYATNGLPPRAFEPVGLSFVGASLSSPGGMEGTEHGFPKDHPLRALFLADRPDGARTPDNWTFNMLLRHGVRSCLEYAKSRDLAKARALSNPSLAPHLEFVDLGGHGYAKVRLSADEMRTEFVCIPRPVTRIERPDGGPLRYRVVHTAPLWKPGERPRLRQEVLEGDPGLSI